MLLPGLRVVGTVFLRWVVLPPYRWLVMTRLRVSKLLASTHGLVFFIFTNRYVGHAALVLLFVFAIFTQWQTKSALASSEGTRSLLYILATQGQEEIFEEPINPGVVTKNSHYLGLDTLVAVPSIDFDYEEGTDQSPADLAIPGNIALQPGTDVSPAAETPIQVTRTKTENYVVQNGDTLGAIASKFGVNVGTILWANKITLTSTIRPGDSLKIPPMSGLLHVVKKGETVETIARLYRVKPEDIISSNHLTAERPLGINDELVVAGGTPPAPVVIKPTKAPSILRPNVPIAKISNKSYDVYQELNTSIGDTRLKPADVDTSNLPENKLLWPTRLHTINQYYGWQHTGIDVEGDYTDPIYAAEDGIIEKAGWNTGGYGLMILIDHDNKMKTRYGHASKLFVQEGQRVTRGEVIGMIGTTGRSTGTHLHFEVYTADGVRRNPLGYIR